MVGSALMRALQGDGVSLVTRSRSELDLTDQAAVRSFFTVERPDEVYIAAAKVGGVHANNTYPAESIYQNMMIVANVIDAAFHNGVRKPLYLGSSCVYPKFVPHRSPRMHYSEAPSNPPMSPTPFRRSRASSSARATTGSTGASMGSTIAA
jgi:GDP-L-fucose synthase